MLKIKCINLYNIFNEMLICDPADIVRVIFCRRDQCTWNPIGGLNWTDWEEGTLPSYHSHSPSMLFREMGPLFETSCRYSLFLYKRLRYLMYLYLTGFSGHVK